MVVFGIFIEHRGGGFYVVVRGSEPQHPTQHPTYSEALTEAARALARERATKDRKP